MNLMRQLLRVCTLAASLASTAAYSSYKGAVPGGYNVSPGYKWGHEGSWRYKSGFASSRKWSRAICLNDADGDGHSNGLELGDPCCVWKQGSTPFRQSTVTHPGTKGDASVENGNFNKNNCIPTACQNDQEILEASPEAACCSGECPRKKTTTKATTTKTTTTKLTTTKTADPCDGVGCSGNGSCKGDGVCLCTLGWEGSSCEKNIDDCDGVTCNGKGTCKDGVDSFTCECNDGWEGDTCARNKNECTDCSGRGFCADGDNDYTCYCDYGYSGKDCETNTDDCVNADCGQDKLAGTCVDKVGGFKCECNDGFRGYTCNQNINECVGVRCSYHGKCVDGVASYSCKCEDGWGGADCETAGGCTVGKDGNQCENGASAVGVTGGCSCKCVNGFTGDNCEKPPTTTTIPTTRTTKTKTKTQTTTTAATTTPTTTITSALKSTTSSTSTSATTAAADSAFTAVTKKTVTLTVLLDVDLASLNSTELVVVQDKLLAAAAEAGRFDATDVENVELVQNGEVVGSSSSSSSRRSLNGPITVRMIFKKDTAVDVDAATARMNRAIDAGLVTVTVVVGGKTVTADITERASYTAANSAAVGPTVDASGANGVPRFYTVLALLPCFLAV